MDSIKLKAYAKINLAIDVLKKRADGYHELKMLMQRIDLYDDIFIKIIDRGIELETNVQYIPTNEQNVVYKVASEFLHKNNIKKGIYIKLIKRIPVAAGLGGGSADAAATLVGLNKMFNCNFTKQELMSFGVKFGADIPFCILGGIAIAEGVGEKLTKLPFLNIDNILVCKPTSHIPTSYVFQKFNFDCVKKKPNMDLLVNAIKNNNINILASNMINVLETVTIKKYPEINKIKSIMIQKGAKGTVMSGSGTSVFGIFPNKYSMYVASDKLLDFSKEIFITRTVNY